MTVLNPYKYFYGVLTNLNLMLFHLVVCSLERHFVEQVAIESNLLDWYRQYITI